MEQEKEGKIIAERDKLYSKLKRINSAITPSLILPAFTTNDQLKKALEEIKNILKEK